MFDDPLQMNDWGIRKFLVVVFVIQISLLGLAALGGLGITIPILPQVFGFICLTFLPGIVLLRILRMHRLGSIITVLYTVGISLAFNMFLGLLINSLYPAIGIAHPISPAPLFATWAVVLGLLCVGAYLRDKNYSYPNDWKLAELLSPSVLFFILLPLLAIAGANAVNYYHNNIVLLVLMALIALIAIVIISTKLMPAHLYPVAVFSIALAFLWHNSLISNHLTGYDIFSEYYYYSQVVQNGYWDQAIPHTYNAMLSIAILPAVYTYFLNISGEAVFKIVYPLLYALVPLALYTICYKQLSSRQAFASSFFFMSIYVFYLTMTSLARQMVAELFFVLLIMLIIDKQITSSRKILFILFGASLVVSHYSLSYIFMAFLILSVIMLYKFKERKSQITIYAVILFSVICLAWYVFVSSSAPLHSIVDLGKRIYQNVGANFLDMFSRDATLYFATPSQNTVHLINRIVYYLMLFFTAVGANRLLTGRNNSFSREYLAFAAGSYALLAACIIVPFFSQALNANRMFHMAIIILAPFSILGFEDTLKALGRLTRFSNHDILRSFSKISLSLLLALFFLFNSGFIFEVAHDPWVASLPLSLGTIEENKRDIQIERKISIRKICPAEQEIVSAKWLANYKEGKLPVYATFGDIRVPSLTAYGLIPGEKTRPILPPNSNSDIGHGYIYLGYVNVIYGYGMTDWSLLKERSGGTWDITELDPVLTKSLKVYNNGVSVIYLSP